VWPESSGVRCSGKRWCSHVFCGRVGKHNNGFTIQTTESPVWTLALASDARIGQAMSPASAPVARLERATGVKMAGLITRARRRARHRGGCYRWYGDGRCVDCGRYTGTARDAVACLLADEVVFSRPAPVPKHRMLERVTLFTDPDVKSFQDDVTHAGDVTAPALPLTADQRATQLAWQRWRIQQGDPEPHIPRRRRNDGKSDSAALTRPLRPGAAGKGRS